MLIFYDQSFWISSADLNILHILLCLCISYYFSIPLLFDCNFLFSEMKYSEKLIFSIIISAWNHTTRHYMIHTFECLAWLSTPQCRISWDLFNSLKLFKTLANNARADIYLDKSTECFHIYSPQGNRQQFRPPLWTTREKKWDREYSVFDTIIAGNKIKCTCTLHINTHTNNIRKPLTSTSIDGKERERERTQWM